MEEVTQWIKKFHRTWSRWPTLRDTRIEFAGRFTNSIIDAAYEGAVR